MGQVIGLLEQNLGQVVHQIRVQILGDDQRRHDGGNHGVLGHALIGAGGDGVGNIVGVVFVQEGPFVLGGRQHAHGRLGGDLDDGGVRHAGGQERGVDLAVLERGGGLSEGQVLGIDVVHGQAAAGEHLLGVHVSAGTLRADGDVLALQVGDAVDVAVGGDHALHGFGIEGADGVEAVEDLVAVEFVAFIGVGHGVVLNGGQVDFAVLDEHDVVLGGVGGLNGHVEVGDVRHPQRRDVSAQRIVGAGSAAGAKRKIGGRLCSGAEADGHNHDQSQSENFFHCEFPPKDIRHFQCRCNYYILENAKAQEGSALKNAEKFTFNKKLTFENEKCRMKGFLMQNFGGFAWKFA